MIVSVGTDIVLISRINQLVNRFGPRFLEKCFTSAENDRCLSHKSEKKQIASFAKLYAAKEAVLKSTGQGLREGMQWHDIEICKDSLGKPIVSLTGKTLDYINLLSGSENLSKVDISLSDDGDYALAFVVVSAYKE